MVSQLSEVYSSMFVSYGYILLIILCCRYFRFFKQKTAYDMRIIDWSSDVCSSDLENLFSWSEHIDLDRRGDDSDNPDAARVANDLDEQIGRASCRERVCQYV